MSDDDQLISALLSLLDDEDRDIVRTAQEKLLEMGEDIVSDLEHKMEGKPLETKVRLREIMQQLSAESLEEHFRTIPVRDGDLNLEAGLFTVARIGYPNLETERYERELDRIAYLVERELNRWQSLDPHTTLNALNHVIFETMGFTGNQDEYYDPRNSYLNDVLTRRTGIPISLCSLMLLVARRLDLPLEGVGMPAHFILSYPGESERIFVDPFNEGKLLSRKQCAQFLVKAGFGYVEEYLEPVSNKEIIERFLRNLINGFQRQGRTHQVKQIRSYLAIVEHRF